MKLILLPDAEEALFEISYFIDCMNLPGSGDKWVDKFISNLYSFARPNVRYALCNDDYLASLGLSCVNINDWIVAFKIEDDTFVVHKIIRGSFIV